MHARSLALLPDCHGTSSIFAPRYCAPGEWVALAPTNGQQLSEEEVVTFVDERVSAFKKLRGGAVITDAIPKTGSGKILRRLVIAQDRA